MKGSYKPMKALKALLGKATAILFYVYHVGNSFPGLSPPARPGYEKQVRGLLLPLSFETAM